MAKTCIICDKRAGSGEHVFPAVLGGRRINKGIYCDAHNRGFSPLAATIGNQLKAINALLAVRPDHKDKAEPFNYTSPEGEALEIFDGVVKHAASAPKSSDQPARIQLMLGGEDGMKAVAYIALTFFAAHFQEEARKPGLRPIKDFVLGMGKNEFAWWELENPIAGLPVNPFPFGHSFVLATSASSGTATAYVSFFGALNFGVALGAIDGLSDRTVVIFIDPQAEAAPHDMQKQEHSAVLIELQKPNPLHAYLAKIVSEGLGQRALQRLLQRIEEWKFTKEMTPILNQLNGVRSLPPDQRGKEITTIVDGQLSRIYRIMCILTDEFAARSTEPLADRITSILKAMVKTEDAPQPAFGKDGELVFLGARAAFVMELDRRLASDAIDMDYLFRLFSGNEGAGIIWKIMSNQAEKIMFGDS
jgi:hypothetical protein